MNFCPARYFARWFGVAALVTAALPASAQQTIQFTKPADPDLPGKANAFLPAASTRQNSASSFNAPSPLFGSRTPTVAFDVLPGSPNMNAMAAANAMQWQKFLESKKNWTLLTPEEILGVQTSEEILGIPDSKNDPKLSAEERFLQRLDGRSAAAGTNGYHHPDADYWRADSTDDPRHPQNASHRFAENLGGTVPGTAKNFSSLFNPNPNAVPEANQRPDSAWANPFNQREPLPKPTPEQLAGMDRFRELMEPTTPEKTPEPARYSYQPPVVTPDPNMQVLPAFNPAGRSFTPLGSAMGRPTGLTPLSDIMGARPAPAKKTPLVQPPPWLSTSPQSFTPLQRQF